MTTSTSAPAAQATSATRADARRARPARPKATEGNNRPKVTPGTPPRPVHPLLHQLAELYPRLFGERFAPLKRGIFQDLMAAHPGVFARDELKVALSQHTRSTRYLSALAEAQPRLGLDGEVAEPTAPEHVFLALVEVMRRRQARGRGDMRAELGQRIVQAMDASGLSPTDYAERVQPQDEWAQTALTEALAYVRERAARAEALQRAYAASGLSVDEFAQTYGISPAQVHSLLRR